MAVPRTVAALLLLMVVGACVADATRTFTTASDSEFARPHGGGPGHGDCQSNRHNGDRRQGDRDDHKDRFEEGHKYKHKYKREHDRLPVPDPNPGPITSGPHAHQPEEKCSVSALHCQPVLDSDHPDKDGEAWSQFTLKEVLIETMSTSFNVNSSGIINFMGLQIGLGGIPELNLDGLDPDVRPVPVDPAILTQVGHGNEVPVVSTGHCSDYIQVTGDGTVALVDKTLYTVEVVKVNAVDAATAAEDSVDIAEDKLKVVSVSGIQSSGSDSAVLCLEMTFSESGTRSWGQCGTESSGKAPAGAAVEDEVMDQSVHLAAADGQLLNFPTKLCWTNAPGGGQSGLKACDNGVVDAVDDSISTTAMEIEVQITIDGLISIILGHDL